MANNIFKKSSNSTKVITNAEWLIKDSSFIAWIKNIARNSKYRSELKDLEIIFLNLSQWDTLEDSEKKLLIRFFQDEEIIEKWKKYLSKIKKEGKITIQLSDIDDWESMILLSFFEKILDEETWFNEVAKLILEVSKTKSLVHFTMNEDFHSSDFSIFEIENYDESCDTVKISNTVLSLEDDF